MPALDDYASPVPLWLVICAVLAESPGGLSVTKVAAGVVQRTHGRFVRASSVSSTLRKMRDDGLCSALIDGEHRNMPALVHTLTPLGVELYTEARAIAFALLETNAKRGR